MIEFDLTPAQTEQLPEIKGGMLYGSVQRKNWPEGDTYFFRGMQLSSEDAQKLKRVAKRIEKKLEEAAEQGE